MGFEVFGVIKQEVRVKLEMTSEAGEPSGGSQVWAFLFCWEDSFIPAGQEDYYQILSWEIYWFTWVSGAGRRMDW